MPRFPFRHMLITAALTAPLCAFAFTANTTSALNVRGGPGTQFGVVAVLPTRTTVRVMRCTTGWRWCEMQSRRVRGWVDSRFLMPSVRGRVPIVYDRPGRRPQRPQPWAPRPQG